MSLPGVFALCCGLGIWFFMILATVLLHKECQISNLATKLYYEQKKSNKRARMVFLLKTRLLVEREIYKTNLLRMQPVNSRKKGGYNNIIAF